MENMRAALILAAAAAAAGTAGMGQDVLRPGRDLSEERDARFQVTVGSVGRVEGMVQETTRRVYEVTGEDFKQRAAENYDLDDFGMEDGYLALGLSTEKAGRFFSWRFDGYLMSPEASALARRDYYIGVGESVVFQGRSYDHMLIPEGARFDMKLDALVMEGRVLLTPFTFALGDGFRVTPALNAGLFAVAGRYDINAGIPTGVTQYQNPPEDFVVRGQSEGYVGMALPEIGFGGEVRVGGDDDLCLVLDAQVGICNFEGSTKWVTSSRHREKDADIDHTNVRLRASLEWPVGRATFMSVGLQYQSIESEASIRAGGQTREEILALRERFDKEAEFEMETVSAVLGLSF